MLFTLKSYFIFYTLQTYWLFKLIDSIRFEPLLLDCFRISECHGQKSHKSKRTIRGEFYWNHRTDIWNTDKEQWYYKSHHQLHCWNILADRNLTTASLTILVNGMKNHSKLNGCKTLLSKLVSLDIYESKIHSSLALSWSKLNIKIF